LGASRATACDIDPSAESCAKTNAELNGVADYNVQIGNIFDEDFLAALTKNGEYDIAVANIVADVIIDLSPLAKKFLKKGGIFVVSGIIDERMPEVLRTLQLDLTVKKFFQNNGWICMVAELDKKAV
ncbi:MAG: 50S ribosomal protein L11 methyltransferase, partial [Defluviitaleaceae bacterium]|nr:50S ribosomal protein L11 methyltransferase [Defluviitaleaceae bacterium]